MSQDKSASEPRDPRQFSLGSLLWFVVLTSLWCSQIAVVREFVLDERSYPTGFVRGGRARCMDRLGLVLFSPTIVHHIRVSLCLFQAVIGFWSRSWLPARRHWQNSPRISLGSYSWRDALRNLILVSNCGDRHGDTLGAATGQGETA